MYSLYRPIHALWHYAVVYARTIIKTKLFIYKTKDVFMWNNMLLCGKVFYHLVIQCCSSLLVAIMLYLQAKPNITYSDRCIPIYTLK